LRSKSRRDAAKDFDRLRENGKVTIGDTC
jgi:hypothetical protein